MKLYTEEQVKQMIEKVKNWWFKLRHGVDRDLEMEVEVICKYRSDENYSHLNDRQMQGLIAMVIKNKYKNLSKGGNNEQQ